MITNPFKDQAEDSWSDVFETKMDGVKSIQREDIMVDHISREDIMVHYSPHYKCNGHECID